MEPSPNMTAFCASLLPQQALELIKSLLAETLGEPPASRVRTFTAEVALSLRLTLKRQKPYVEVSVLESPRNLQFDVGHEASLLVGDRTSELAEWLRQTIVRAVWQRKEGLVDARRQWIAEFRGRCSRS